MMKTFTGICSETAVASSWEVICSEPSPARHTTVSSGQAALAPIDEGRPNPIVPRPPELIQRRGLEKWKYWAHHIWCWPTSEVTKASPLVTS